jgi:SAM-dependent methyltransferase
VSVRAGEIDWVASFAAMAAASETTTKSRPTDRWQERAARYDRMSRNELAISQAIEGLTPHVRPTDVVLDVGAGTGRHAVPLAARCARVIAIEPSTAMRERLLARLAEERVENVEVRDASWPDAGAPMGDLVFSAHVAYGVADIAPFLALMTARSRRTCALVLKRRAPADALGRVFEAVHGVPRARRPAALEALAVLHQLGHHAELNLVEGSARKMTFADTEDELRELADRIGVEPDGPGLARVRAALERVAERTETGWIAGDTGPTACITWPGGARGARKGA